MRTKWVWFFVAIAGLAVAQQQPAGDSSGKPAPRQKIRVSSGVVQRQVLSKVLPEASDLKSLKNAEVKIVFETDETGAVTSVLRTEGDPALYDRCIEAIKDWRFKPFFLDGKPIIVESYVYFHFHKGKASVLFHH